MRESVQADRWYGRCYNQGMTTIVLVLATVWAIGAIGFFGALCLAAKRTMPVPDADPCETNGSEFACADHFRSVRRDLACQVGPLLGHGSSMLAARSHRA